MAFDPSIISQIPDFAPNPVAAREQGLRLADMQTTQQSNQLQLRQHKESYEDTQKARNILKGAKLDSPQDVTKAAEKLTQAGLPDQAMSFMKAMQGLQESKGALSLQQYQLLEKKNDIIGTATAGLVGQYDQLIQQGASPALAAAIMQPRYQQAIQQLGQTKLPDGSGALGSQDMQQIQQNPQFNPNFLRTIADRSKEGAAALRAQMQFHQDQLKERAENRQEKMTDIAERRLNETQREDRAKDEARTKSETGELSPAAVDIAGMDVMADPAKMKQYASYSAKDPRKNQINEWIAQKLKASNMGWPDLARLRQRFRSEAKSIDKLSAQRDSIEGFEEFARTNGARALELIDMIDDTGVPMIEGFRRSAKRKLGGVDEAELASVLNSFQTEIARIIGGNPNMTGVVTDTARKDIQAIAPQSMTAAQAKRIINRLYTEMDVRREMLDTEIDRAENRATQLGTASDTPRPERNPDGSLKRPPGSGTAEAGSLPPGFVLDQ